MCTYAMLLLSLVTFVSIDISDGGCCCGSSSSSSSAPKFLMTYSNPPLPPPFPPPGPASAYYGGMAAYPAPAVPAGAPPPVGGAVPVPAASYPGPLPAAGAPGAVLGYPPPIYSPPMPSPFGPMGMPGIPGMPPMPYYSGAFGGMFGGGAFPGTTFTTYGSLGSSCFWMFGRKKRGADSEEDEEAASFTPVKASDNETVIGNGNVTTIEGRILIGNGNFYSTQGKGLEDPINATTLPSSSLFLTITTPSTPISTPLAISTHSIRSLGADGEGETVTTNSQRSIGSGGPDFGYVNLTASAVTENSSTFNDAFTEDVNWEWVPVGVNVSISSGDQLDDNQKPDRGFQAGLTHPRRRRRVKRQCCGCGCCGCGCGCCGGGQGGGTMGNNTMGNNMGGGCGCCGCGCGCGCCCGGQMMGGGQQGGGGGQQGGGGGQQGGGGTGTSGSTTTGGGTGTGTAPQGGG